MANVRSLSFDLYEDVLLAHIARDGFDGYRVARLADAIGVSVGVMYRHIGLKAEGLELVWGRVLQRVNNRIARLLEEETVELTDVWDAMTEALPRHHPRAFFLMHDARQRWRCEHFERDGEFLPALVAVFQMLQRREQVRGDDAATLSAIAWNTMVSAFRIGPEVSAKALETGRRCFIEAMRHRPDEQNYDLDPADLPIVFEPVLTRAEYLAASLTARDVTAASPEARLDWRYRLPRPAKRRVAGTSPPRTLTG